MKELEAKVLALDKERDRLMKQRDSAFQEATLWRSELGKARERAVILEGAIVRAEEKARVAEADAESKIKEAAQKETVAMKEKQELLAYVNVLQAQLQRFESYISYFKMSLIQHSFILHFEVVVPYAIDCMG